MRLNHNHSLLVEYQKIWYDFEHEHHDPQTLLNQLKDSFPWDSRSLRLETWTIEEAVFAYYGLHYDTLVSMLNYHSHHPLIDIIDHEKICNLLINILKPSVYKPVSVSVKGFIGLLNEKQIPIPSHLCNQAQNLIEANPWVINLPPFIEILRIT